jgi:hypothetical protein
MVWEWGKGPCYGSQVVGVTAVDVYPDEEAQQDLHLKIVYSSTIYLCIYHLSTIYRLIDLNAVGSPLDYQYVTSHIL